MPSLFRIMGGGNSTARQQSQQSDNNNTNNNAAASSNNRFTYPGMRASAPASTQAAVPPAPPASSSMPVTPPRMGLASSAPPPQSLFMQHQPTASNQVQPIFQGSRVVTNEATHSAPPSSLSSSMMNSSTTNPFGPPPTTETAHNPASSVNNNSSPLTTRPGAYMVTRVSTGPAQVYRVTVPAGVRPGSEFTVHAGPRRVRVRCPPTSKPGQSLQITLPPEPVTSSQLLKMAPLTAVHGDEPGGGTVAMTPDVLTVNQQAEAAGGTAQTYLVTIPPNVYPGQQFTVNVAGQRFMVTCPPTAGPNQKVRIVPPAAREEPEAAPTTQVFEVAVPPGVHPGQPFALVANGQRVLVTCPPGVSPGQKIRFQLPVSQVVQNISLAYESETTGWRRTVRATDLKFLWVRLDNKKDDEDKKDGTSKTKLLMDEPQEEEPVSTSASSAAATNNVDLDAMEKFDFKRSAYVRKITFWEGNDARMRTGHVELIPAHEAVVDSRLVSNNRTLLSYADIAQVQGKSLAEKTAWFQSICAQLTTAWDDGHVKIVVRRAHLLADSVDAIMSLGREDLRKRWRIEFLGEPAIDAGGVTREWFELTTAQLFDPAFGLWVASVNNQACVDINPASGLSCPDDHLIYFRFLGRVVGRALFDRQLIKGHMVRTIYKHLLGWPITFDDIKAQDEEYYQSLRKLTKMDDVSDMCLDFTVTEENMGVRREVELVEGGSMTEVTNENLAQYLEANLRYRMLDRIKPQLKELLLGFYDVVPEPALTVFDSNELELSLCGLPTIDMDDWKLNTKYSGLFEIEGKTHRVVKWFWEVVSDEFDSEMRARLLQFVTGTSGVPARGFSVLQGSDGNIKKFTIHGVDRISYAYPRAHTCFNRIDLPNYTSKEELLDRLRGAVIMSGVGFDIE